MEVVDDVDDVLGGKGGLDDEDVGCWCWDDDCVVAVEDGSFWGVGWKYERCKIGSADMGL